LRSRLSKATLIAKLSGALACSHVTPPPPIIVHHLAFLSPIPSSIPKTNNFDMERRKLLAERYDSGNNYRSLPSRLRRLLLAAGLVCWLACWPARASCLSISSQKMERQSLKSSQISKYNYLTNHAFNSSGPRTIAQFQKRSIHNLFSTSLLFIDSASLLPRFRVRGAQR
jgi:hypothetical protein